VVLSRRVLSCGIAGIAVCELESHGVSTVGEAVGFVLSFGGRGAVFIAQCGEKATGHGTERVLVGFEGVVVNLFHTAARLIGWQFFSSQVRRIQGDRAIFLSPNLGIVFLATGRYEEGCYTITLA